MPRFTAALLGTRRKAYLPEAQQTLQEMPTNAWLYYVEHSAFNATGFMAPTSTRNWAWAYVTCTGTSCTMTVTGVTGSPVVGASVQLILDSTGRGALSSSGF